jgi:hypothetical protein
MTTTIVQADEVTGNLPQCELSRLIDGETDVIELFDVAVDPAASPDDIASVPFALDGADGEAS